MKRKLTSLKKTTRQFAGGGIVGFIVAWPWIVSFFTEEPVDRLMIPYQVILRIIGVSINSDTAAVAALGILGISLIRIAYLIFKLLILISTACFQCAALAIGVAWALKTKAYEDDPAIPFTAHLVLASLGRRYYNEILGDLSEQYPVWGKAHGPRLARLCCYCWIASCLRVRLIESLDTLLTLKRRTAR